MAYDEAMAERVRALLAGRDGLSEKKMFGSLGFLAGGNLAVAVAWGSQLIVRLDPHDSDSALAEPGTSRFAPGGRPMKGWILVDAEALESDTVLADWVEWGWSHATSLPAK